MFWRPLSKIQISLPLDYWKPWIKQLYLQLEMIFVKVFLSCTNWYGCGLRFVSNGLLCALQVLISHAETKDGSGGPLDYEDLEPGDGLSPRNPVGFEKTFREPTEPQSVIVVRQWNYCGSVSVRVALHCRVKADKSRPQIYRSTSLCESCIVERNTISQSPLVLVKTYLAPAISLCFHEVCFLNLTWHFPFESFSIFFPLLTDFPLSHPFLVSHLLFLFYVACPLCGPSWCSNTDSQAGLGHIGLESDLRSLLMFVLALP